MIPNSNNFHQSSDARPSSVLFWTLLIPILLACLGMSFVLYFSGQEDGNDLVNAARTDYRHIPPELIGYKQTSVSVCPIKGAAICFAVQNDATFIVGTAHPHSLCFFDENGTLLKKTDLAEEPKAVVCGTAETILSDKIVVSHPTRIALYETDGRAVHSLGNGDGFDLQYRVHGADIQSLALTSKYLFAADSGNRRFYRFDEFGKTEIFGHFPMTVGTPLDSSSRQSGNYTMGDFSVFGGFVVYASPITMTFSPKNDLLYVSNPGKHRVEVFTQEGVHQPKLSWGEPSGDVSGFAGCCNPIGLTALDDGRIVTVEKAVSRIKIFGKDRRLDCVVAGASILDETPAELERKPSKPGGRYFSAAELSDKRIAVFDLDNAVLRFFTPLETY